jgi:hypothetical protein
MGRDGGPELVIRGEEVLEDVPQCPYCERFISEEDHPTRRQPVWIIVTAVICLGMAIWWAISA